jgi:hypothetical protein
MKKNQGFHFLNLPSKERTQNNFRICYQDGYSQGTV